MQPLPGMNQTEVDALLAEVARGAVTPRTAIALLLINGREKADAERSVFLALGGGGAIEKDALGRERYAGSGRLVSEVQQALAT